MIRNLKQDATMKTGLLLLARLLSMHARAALTKPGVGRLTATLDTARSALAQLCATGKRRRHATMTIGKPHLVKHFRVAAVLAVLVNTSAEVQILMGDGAKTTAKLVHFIATGKQRIHAWMTTGLLLRVNHFRQAAVIVVLVSISAEVQPPTGDIAKTIVRLAHCSAIGKLRKHATMTIGKPRRVKHFRLAAVLVVLVKLNAEVQTPTGDGAKTAAKLVPSRATGKQSRRASTTIGSLCRVH